MMPSELVIGDRGAEQAEVKIPVGFVTLEEVHGFLQFLMGLEEGAAIEQLDTASEVLAITCIRHQGSSVSWAVSTSVRLSAF